MRILFIVALFSVGVSAGAEDLKQIYSLALEYDPQFAQSKIQREIASQTMRQSLSSLLPTVNIQTSGLTSSKTKSRATYPSEFLNDPRYQSIPIETSDQWFISRDLSPEFSGYDVSLSQVLFSIPTFIQFRNSRLNYQGSKDTFKSSERQLIIRVVDAYFAVLQARDSLENTLARRESIERQLQQTEQRYEVGLTAITDVLNARATYDNQDVQLSASRNQLDTTFLALKRLTGRPIQQLARFSKDYPIENPTPNNEDQWVQFALNNNPDVLSAQRGYSISRWSHWSTLANYLPIPDISLNVSYNFSDNSPIPDPFINNLDSGYFLNTERISRGYGFNVNFTFSSGGALSRNRVSALQREQSRLQLMNQRLAVEEQTRTQFRSVVQTVLQIAALERSLESNRASLEATEKGYEVGTRNIIEVLNAQNSLFAAELDYQNTIYRYITSMLRLKQTVGLLSVNDLLVLNEYMDHENVVTPANTLTGK